MTGPRGKSPRPWNRRSHAAYWPAGTAPASEQAQRSHVSALTPRPAGLCRTMTGRPRPPCSGSGRRPDLPVVPGRAPNALRIRPAWPPCPSGRPTPALLGRTDMLVHPMSTCAASPSSRNEPNLRDPSFRSHLLQSRVRRAAPRLPGGRSARMSSASRRPRRSTNPPRHE